MDKIGLMFFFLNQCYNAYNSAPLVSQTIMLTDMKCKIQLKFILLGFLTLLSLLSFSYTVKADISVTSPPNWQPSSLNNSTQMMIWLQNSTKSMFLIASSPPHFLPLPLISGFFGQALAEKGILQSSDQISFGKSNFGYRYFLDLSQYPLNTSSSQPTPQVGILSDIIRYYFNNISQDIHLKGMLIISQKYNQLYSIALLTPSENFDSISNEIQPSLDSISITGNYSK